MSRKVNMEDPSAWSKEEILYLHSRCKIDDTERDRLLETAVSENPEEAEAVETEKTEATTEAQPTDDGITSDPGPTPPEPLAVQAVPYEDLDRDALVALAIERGFEVPKGTKSKAIIDALREEDASKEAGE